MTSLQRSIRRNLWAGIGIAFALVGSVGAWAATTDIGGAVIAPGTVVVDTNVRKVQHPTGGVIGAILARDGDRVRADDILVQLDATVTRANLAVVSKSLDTLLARKARLEAERDELFVPVYPLELTRRASDPDVATTMAGESRLFQLRHIARTGQKAQLRQRISQLEHEGLGLEQQIGAKAQEILLIHKELGGARLLWDKNLYPVTKLTQLEREATRLEGERGQLTASTAQARGRISEIELQIVQIDRELATEVARELREAESKISELLERKVAAEDQLGRVSIRAPVDGIVHQSAVHTVGGVITASGDTIMLIVPESDLLAVEAKVPAGEIDQIQVGRSALLRFPAFNQRTTPELSGAVTRISADAVVDQRRGDSFYTVRVALSPNEIASLGKSVLVPGMPVEVFVQTEHRTVASYLLKPLTDQFARAFRER